MVKHLLEYTQATESNLQYSLLLVLGLLLTEVVRSWSLALTWALNYRTGVRLRGAILTMAFKKILKLKNIKEKSLGEVSSEPLCFRATQSNPEQALSLSSSFPWALLCPDLSSGYSDLCPPGSLTIYYILQLINICSNDGQRMFEAAAVGSLLAGGPVVAILGMIYNVIILGPTGFLGSAVFILFYPTMVSEPFGCIMVASLYGIDKVLGCRKRIRCLLKQNSWKSLMLGSAQFTWAELWLGRK